MWPENYSKRHVTHKAFLSEFSQLQVETKAGPGPVVVCFLMVFIVFITVYTTKRIIVHTYIMYYSKLQ